MRQRCWDGGWRVALRRAHVLRATVGDVFSLGDCLRQTAGEWVEYYEGLTEPIMSAKTGYVATGT